MGKTKDIIDTESCIVRLVNKPIITAGDGEKKEQIVGKDVLATTTTLNIFRLLEKCGVETHFLKQDSPSSFLAIKCQMIPIEVVIRRKIGEKSSFLKRYPKVQPGTILEDLEVEFFLKDDKRHDPIIVFNENGWVWIIHDPKKPISLMEESFLGEIDRLCLPFEIEKMEETAKLVFSILEQALLILDITLEDLKIEFGHIQMSTSQGEIILADVIDNDSWRITKDGQDISKQGFRDGDDLKTVENVYKIVAELSKQLPELASKIKIE
ncbi:MAG: phosphoribosylaminoimidazolesuccinocarboxamide synthase [Patescibacteria group bacterium]|nr:phosphoribosylaminoimidazolesuccinocarboxamide synthase [Patescibacteria group bacterium]